MADSTVALEFVLAAIAAGLTALAVIYWRHG